MHWEKLLFGATTPRTLGIVTVQTEAHETAGTTEEFLILIIFSFGIDWENCVLPVVELQFPLSLTSMMAEDYRRLSSAEAHCYRIHC